MTSRVDSGVFNHHVNLTVRLDYIMTKESNFSNITGLVANVRPTFVLAFILFVIANRPFSGAPSGEKLLLRWTSYQASLCEKHSFYDRLVGKLQQRG